MPAIDLRFPQGREFNGGDLLAQSLSALGIGVAFGIHGGHLDSFFMGCADIGLRLVDTRHETVAVQAAEGYARVKGPVGVAFVTSNSGFSNGLPGLATAFADKSPIIVITSSPPMADTGTNPIQGIIDQVDVARRMTKFAQRVSEPEQIPRFVAHAYRTAISGAPGPVLLEFPIDVLYRPVLQHRIAWGSIASPTPHPPAPAPEAVQEVLEVWKRAQRPAILIGSGGRSPQVAEALRELVAIVQTPVFQGPKMATYSALDAAYVAGAWSNLAALPFMGKPRPDMILLLGGRPGMLLAGQTGAILPPEGCTLIHVDTDGTEIGRFLHTDIGIQADVLQTIRALNVEFSRQESPLKAPPDWLALAMSLQHLPSPAAQEPVLMPSGRLHPYHALKRVFSSLEPGAIVCLDGGECSVWAGDVIHEARPHLMLGPLGYLAFLGTGFGYSLGAAIAEPTRQVVNLQGDGSAGFHFVELDTYARFNLNILTVVVNNYAWAMSLHGQELFYGDKHPARMVSKLSPSAEYHKVAAGFGNEATQVTKLEEIDSAVKSLSSAYARKQRPACLNLIVDDAPIHMLTRLLMNSNPSPDQINIPYYQPIPRPYYKSNDPEDPESSSS